MAEPLKQERLEHRVVVVVFRLGLIVAFSVLVVGLIIWVSAGSPEVAAVDLSNLGDLSNPAAVMGIGIVVLGATPVVNVLALLVLWIRRRQLRLTLIALAVLSTLVVAVLLGRM